MVDAWMVAYPNHYHMLIYQYRLALLVCGEPDRTWNETRNELENPMQIIIIIIQISDDNGRRTQRH